MNRPPRGTNQDESIVVRVTAKDKAQINLESQRRGVSMSVLIRESLMQTKLIDPIVEQF
jgi:predicted HicB family RNase H-like nuclease